MAPKTTGTIVRVELTPALRKDIEDTLLRIFRLRYPGCAITVGWDDDSAASCDEPPAQESPTRPGAAYNGG